MDARTSEVVGELLLKSLETAEEKIDEEIHRLDHLEEDDLEAIRRKRLETLKRNQTLKMEWKAKGHGSYDDIPEEKAFFEICKRSKRVVAHFGRPVTRRCEILDRHLGDLARKHIETKFIKINAEKSPVRYLHEFLAERLRIYMLPTVVLVKDGKTEYSIIGFDDMGGTDDFPTEALERVLLEHEVVLESFCG